MTPERWEQIRGLLESAMQLVPAQRPAYLDRHCSDDPTLRKDVDSFLVSEQEMSAAFLESPAINMAARSRAAVEQGEHSPEEDDLRLVGTTVSHYEILAKLGGGGMGVVYKARDTKLGRFVALKFLPSKLSQDPQAIGRLQREAHAASALNHPSICTIHDIDEHKGQPFIAMEYLAGKTLKHEMEGQRLSVNRILDLGIQLSDGLNAAHVEGIIHRDIKPANIFIADPGRVKILDFGLAKLAPWPELDDQGCPSRSLQDSVSSPGAVLGTVMYMSPEQIRGEELDSRTDLFSFSAVLFEMATGQRAFSRDTTAAITQAILQERPVEVLRLAPSVPTELGRIIDRGLEKDRAQRYQSAAEMRTDLLRLKDSELRPATASTPSGRRVRSKRRWRTFVWIAMPLVGAAVSAFLLHRTPPLSERGTIVLADFTNTTGDPVFDGTLRQGLSAQLEQSPFLNLLSDERIAQTLALMTRPKGTALTYQIAGEVCRRTGGTATVQGSIANFGSQYVLGLKAVDCGRGDLLAHVQLTAYSKEQVLKALGDAATQLRRRLGESLGSVHKYDVPQEDVTTSSLEALNAYSLGLKALIEKGPVDSIPFFRRAVQLDPNFAMAYLDLGIEYGNLGEWSQHRQNLRRAFALRDRVSTREALNIASTYYDSVEGDLQKAQEIFRVWAQTYPQDPSPLDHLGNDHLWLGQYPQALEVLRQEEELAHGGNFNYGNLASAYLCLNRLSDARRAVEQARARNQELVDGYDYLYRVDFLEGNTSGMQADLAWAAGKSGIEDIFLNLQSDTEAYLGRLREGRVLSQRAVDSARGSGESEVAATHWANAALREAEFGNSNRALKAADSALSLSHSRDVKTLVGLALARAGFANRAMNLANELAKSNPSNTLLNVYWLPLIRAASALSLNHPALAVEILQPTGPYELAAPILEPGTLYPVYVRGQAYLRLNQATSAAEEFQKLPAHSGCVVNFPLGALAHLGLARAYRLQDDTTKARAAYQDFLVLWKDADPEIPILKQAKAEYEKTELSVKVQ